MNSIEKLKQEHVEIERELFELESIMQEEIINYPNLIHVFKKLCKIWNEHEEKEEKIFSILKHERIIFPVEKMLFEHKELNPYRKAIEKAIESRSEFEIKKVLNNQGKIIIEKLRKHIKDEDEILYRITPEIFTPEELKELLKFELKI